MPIAVVRCLHHVARIACGGALCGASERSVLVLPNDRITIQGHIPNKCIMKGYLGIHAVCKQNKNSILGNQIIEYSTPYTELKQNKYTTITEDNDSQSVASARFESNPRKEAFLFLQNMVVLSGNGQPRDRRKVSLSRRRGVPT